MPKTYVEIVADEIRAISEPVLPLERAQHMLVQECLRRVGLRRREADMMGLYVLRWLAAIAVLLVVVGLLMSGD